MNGSLSSVWKRTGDMNNVVDLVVNNLQESERLKQPAVKKHAYFNNTRLIARRKYQPFTPSLHPGTFSFDPVGGSIVGKSCRRSKPLRLILRIVAAIISLANKKWLGSTAERVGAIPSTQNHPKTMKHKPSTPDDTFYFVIFPLFRVPQCMLIESSPISLPRGNSQSDKNRVRLEEEDPEAFKDILRLLYPL
ncbi:hypothetical protein BU17DRAFT_70657 [Hysterangium stoloniferum]|nr:hypothetical protein BU17DRAFT_70657 [Hysterangium stoloniferum]